MSDHSGVSLLGPCLEGALRWNLRRSNVSNEPFTRDLAAEEYGLLAPLFRHFEAPARTLIIKQGDEAAYLYLITEGHVTLRYKPYDGPRITLTHLHAGDIFGWSAVIGHETYTSDAVSTTPIRTLRLRGEDLRQLCLTHPSEGGHILERLARAVSPRWVYARKQIEGLLQESLRPLSAIPGSS